MASKIRKFLDIQGLLKLIRLVKNNEQPHWIGTQAEYDSQKANIPNGAIVALTDEEDTTYDHGKYALVETVTGKRWIDGKPIYRKCYTFTTTAGSGQVYTHIPSGVTGIDTVISQTGAVHTISGNSHYWMPIPWAYTSAIMTGSYYAKDSNVFVVNTSRDVENGKSAFLIVEYTKTVD